MMTASSIKNGALSGFTLALLEDSGWYLPNYDAAEPMFWGKGQGKDFLENQCKSNKKYREFSYDDKP